ncbi:MAG: hypothetical protein R3C05_13770 [Pirellulaceae bacterium]
MPTDRSRYETPKTSTDDCKRSDRPSSPRKQEAEAVRGVRTNLLLSLSRSDKKVVMVTSPFPGTAEDDDGG